MDWGRTKKEEYGINRIDRQSRVGDYGRRMDKLLLLACYFCLSDDLSACNFLTPPIVTTNRFGAALLYRLVPTVEIDLVGYTYMFQSFSRILPPIHPLLKRYSY